MAVCQIHGTPPTFKDLSTQKLELPYAHHLNIGVEILSILNTDSIEIECHPLTILPIIINFYSRFPKNKLVTHILYIHGKMEKWKIQKI